MITYLFHSKDKKEYKFRIDVNRTYTLEIDHRPHQFWTKLDFHQCPICPLGVQEMRFCPTAVDMEDVVGRFSSLISYEEVDVQVIAPEREYRKTCDIQTGLQALVGLIMATSACPVLSRLKTLANFHLPFATLEDTIFRTVGAYLIQQYYIHMEGGKGDFELKKLKNYYNDLSDLNTAFLRRIEIASESDANLNALVQLEALSFMMHVTIEEELKHFRKTMTSGIDPV